MGTVTLSKSGRDSYHHGDLANALTAAATELAREGGPEAVVLREAARQVGVSPTAAYRHFASHGDLIHAVKEHAQQALVESMQRELSASEPLPDTGAEAVRRLRALGLGYIRFALAEPGLFRTAFCRSDKDHEEPLGMLSAAAFLMLVQTLDDLVEVGMMAPADRPYSEMFAWSGAHGLANLLLDGPLRHLAPAEREAAINRTLDAMVDGLIPGRPGRTRARP
jgi:AcrR family transcriptional regulator